MTAIKEINIADENDHFLTIRARPHEDYFVMDFNLESPGLKAQSNDITITNDFIAFFKEMANDWRGWQGKKVYDDGAIRLSAESDRTGHMKLNILIHSQGWSADSTITLQAGQLEHLSRKVENLIKDA